jgi:hypothetical protein
MSTLAATTLKHASSASNNIVLTSGGGVGIGTSSPRAQTHVFGLGQTTAALTDAGNRGGMLRVSDNSTSAGAGGAILFASAQGDTANSTGFAAIKGLLSDGSGNTVGDLSFSTRNGAADTSLTERMRITNGGNVGIGTSSPGAKLEVVGNIKIGGYNIIGGANNSTVGMFAGTAFNTGGASIVTRGISNGFNDGGIEFYTGSGATGSERMRITAAGRIGIKTSVPTSLLTISTPGDTENITKLTINGYGDFRGYGCIMQPNNDTNCVPFLFTNAAGTVVGSISTNASGTSFTTSSDYRLKHDVQPLTTGLATIAALKPSTYKWNADDSHGEGFIAHELAEHIPHAVTGEKDAVNADGSIKPQAVDYSKIVVHLVAALQELKAESDALKARIATLEARQ